MGELAHHMFFNVRVLNTDVNECARVYGKVLAHAIATYINGEKGK